MAVEIGTASGHLDLLDRLVAFLTTNPALVAANQQWTALRNITPAFDNADGLNGQQEVVLKGPGLAGVDEFFFGITAFKSDALDYYNWSMKGLVGYLGTVGHANQPGQSGSRFLHLWNQPIPYWFIASGRRVIIVAKISTVYQTAYLGAYLPYATPSQYPYPMLCGGSSSFANYRWSSVERMHRAFFDPNQSSLAVYYPDGSWLLPANFDPQDSSRPDWPNVGPYNGSDASQRDAITRIRDNIDGSYSTLPIRISTITPPAVLGELDGMYYVSGHNNASENIVQIDGVDHLVVQNTFRTERYNYAAIRLS